MPPERRMAASEMLHQKHHFPAYRPFPFFPGEAALASEEAAAHLYIARREFLRRCLIHTVLFAALQCNNECNIPTLRGFDACHRLPSQGICLVGTWHPDSIIMAFFRTDISHAGKRASIDALSASNDPARYYVQAGESRFRTCTTESQGQKPLLQSSCSRIEVSSGTTRKPVHRCLR